MYQRDTKETPGCLIAVAAVVLFLLVLAMGWLFEAIPYVVAAMLVG